MKDACYKCGLPMANISGFKKRAAFFVGTSDGDTICRRCIGRMKIQLGISVNTKMQWGFKAIANMAALKSHKVQ